MLINRYTETGQHQEAERVIERLGPLAAVSDPPVLFQVGISRIHTGRRREALELLERAQALDPYQWAHYKRILGWANLINGRTEEASAMYESAWGNPDVLRKACSTGGLQVALNDGDPRMIRKWLMRALEFHESGSLRFYQAMETHLGDPLAALAYLREVFEHPYEDLKDQPIAIWAAFYDDHQLALEATLRTPENWLVWHPLMAEVRTRPEFRDMLRELGLVAYWREYGWSDFCRPTGEYDFECE